MVHSDISIISLVIMWVILSAEGIVTIYIVVLVYVLFVFLVCCWISIFPVHVFHMRGIIDFGRCAMKSLRGRIVLIWFDCLIVFGCISLLCTNILVNEPGKFFSS